MTGIAISTEGNGLEPKGCKFPCDVVHQNCERALLAIERAAVVGHFYRHSSNALRSEWSGTLIAPSAWGGLRGTSLVAEAHQNCDVCLLAFENVVSWSSSTLQMRFRLNGRSSGAPANRATLGEQGEPCRRCRATWVSQAPLQRKRRGGWLSTWDGRILIGSRVMRIVAGPSTRYSRQSRRRDGSNLKPEHANTIGSLNPRGVLTEKLATTPPLPPSSGANSPVGSPLTFARHLQTLLGRLRNVKEDWCSTQRATNDKEDASQVIGDRPLQETRSCRGVQAIAPQPVIAASASRAVRVMSLSLDDAGCWRTEVAAATGPTLRRPAHAFTAEMNFNAAWADCVLHAGGLLPPTRNEALTLALGSLLILTVI
ncbi:hypothetical protein Purlil1_13290 [Purpureocillium lilacinum]|uniref:Uncharacterized protein n=1 Tax=Purpureocillium lilacinum TaxID=33203 RepID=A0ABR0BEJ9_PURLI|nr:hypothetical protein Purlil1_13290 [Purpureocillium lilacinum]